ncbi:MAG: HEAT repeat domain-containing protein [Cyanobacteria bacterium P01_F01_bin.86]
MPFDTDFVITPTDLQDLERVVSTPQLETALRLLLEGDFQSRWEATKRLPTFGKATIARLVPLLEDEDLDWEVRWFAARTLGNFNETEALESLVQLIQQTDEPELITIAAEGLSHFGAKAVNALIQLFKNPAYRITAVQALASIRHKAALSPLLIAAEDANPQVRTVAFSALGHFRDARVDPLLMDAVKDPVAAVRQEAITHLGLRPHLLATVDLVSILQPGLWDVNPKVTEATAIALGRLGTESAIAVLAQVLQSAQTPESLQRVIVRSLGWIDQEAALLALLSVRVEVLMPVQLEIIETLTRFESNHLRQQAGEALCDWLGTCHQDPQSGSVKQAIALALGDLHPPQAQSLLQVLVQEDDPQTALYAEAALRQLEESA